MRRNQLSEQQISSNSGSLHDGRFDLGQLNNLNQGEYTYHKTSSDEFNGGK